MMGPYEADNQLIQELQGGTRGRSYPVHICRLYHHRELGVRSPPPCFLGQRVMANFKAAVRVAHHASP